MPTVWAVNSEIIFENNVIKKIDKIALAKYIKKIDKTNDQLVYFTLKNGLQ